MSAMDDLRKALGPDLGRPSEDRERTDRQRWTTVCVCGHQVGAHGPGIGGSYPVPEPEAKVSGGRPIRVVQTAPGCVGAMPAQTFERFSNATETVDDVMVITRTVNATCGCREFRAVARVDRAHRYFNQRQPADRGDYTKHPLIVGMRAYRKRIGKLKRAHLSEVGEVWADEEFDRRFQWLPDARTCTQCSETEDVWPAYVDDRGTSEMRCAQHRP